MLRRIRVLIMGGGISGCSLWLALRQQTERSLARGKGPVFSATVYEQAKRIDPVGAGISLGPNGLRVLDSLGLLDKIKVLGGEVSNLHVYTDRGELLRTFDCTFASKRHSYPLICMERAELQALLVHQVLRSSSILPISVNHSRPMVFGKRCANVYDLGNDGVSVKFSDGTEAVGDLVVGTDGARSAVRAAVLSDSSPKAEQEERQRKSSQLEYAGISCLLGVTSSVPESIVGSAYWVLGKGKIYGTWSMGKQKQYWFLTKKETLSSENPEGQWTPTEAVLGMDELWNWYHPYDAHAMFSRTVRAVKVGFYQMPQQHAIPLSGSAASRRGSFSRVAILGDAAHAMLPTVHQGANIAVEDAAVLAHSLASRCTAMDGGNAGHTEDSPSSREGAATSSSDKTPVGMKGAPEVRDADEDTVKCIQDAVRDFAASRSSRVHKVVEMSSRTGRWQTSDSASVDFVRNLALKWVPQSYVENSLDWIYSYRLPRTPS